MPNKHAGENLGVRAPSDVRANALAVLRARNISIREFVVACLNAVIATPDSMLKSLKPHWPEPPTKGLKKAPTDPPKRP